MKKYLFNTQLPEYEELIIFLISFEYYAGLSPACITHGIHSDFYIIYISVSI